MAVQESKSIAQVIRRLSLVPAGGNYASVKVAIETLGLDTSHFTGSGWRKGTSLGPKRDITVYLSNQAFIGSHKLKKRLLAEGIFEHKCYSCENTEWMGKSIPLELEHINGCHKDNSLENLTLLCPNCHAQTDTYRGKNVGKAPVV